MNRVRFYGAMHPSRWVTRKPRKTWAQIADVACWCLIVAGTTAGAAFVLGYTVRRLGAMWGGS